MAKGLVLTRRVGESCVCFLGETEVQIVIDEIAGKKVRLRFIADQTVEILRSEILEQ